MTTQNEQQPQIKAGSGRRCGMFHLRRTSRSVGRLYAGIFDQTGIDSSHFSTLMIVSRLGPLSISEVARRMGLDRTTMSRNLKPLSSKRLIKISDSGYGRTRQVEITRAGEKALSIAIPRWEAAQEKLRNLIGEQDMDTLIALLERVYEVTQSEAEP